MSASEKLTYRKKLLDDAARLQKLERVPHISNFALWPILDYGIKLSEATRDWQMMEKVQRAFIEKYQFDSPGFLCGLLGNPSKMIDKIGPGYNVFDDETGRVLIDDMDLLQADEYDEFINDLPGLMWNKLLPRKYPNWPEVTVGILYEAIEELNRFNAYKESITKACLEEYGVALIASLFNLPAYELLFNVYRGMKNLAFDMRRIPDKLQEACEAIDFRPGAFDGLFDADRRHPGAAFGISIVLLGHNFLSLQQWERYEWPYIQRVIDEAVKADSTVFIFFEGIMSRFYDYFRDVPAGHLVIQTEQDDVFDIKANLPNVCVAGGMTTRLLGGGTTKQCVDWAKHLCDELGREGGFILCQDKMMSYMRDANPENLKAVCDFVADYRL